MRSAILLFVMAICCGVVSAQTDTPTPALTLPLEPVVFATTASGQMTRFDYTATAGDIQISLWLTLIFISCWGMFLFAIFVYVRRRA